MVMFLFNTKIQQIFLLIMQSRIRYFVFYYNLFNELMTVVSIIQLFVHVHLIFS